MAGFRPIRHQTGGGTFRTKFYPCIVSGAVFIGDPVRISAGVAKPLGTATAAQGVLGAVAGVYGPDKRPHTFALPANGPHHLAGVTGEFLLVYDDPDIVWEVEIDATASAALIGVGVTVSAGTPVTAGGQSGYVVGTAGTAAEQFFRIVGVSPVDDLDDDGVADTNVEVMIIPRFHTFGL